MDGGSGPSRFARLLALERELRHAENAAGVRYIAVNDLRRVLLYRQAAVIDIDPRGQQKITALSGVSAVEGDAPYVRWLSRIVANRAAHEYHVVDLAESPDATWREFSARFCLWLPLTAPGEKSPRAALWLAADQPWTNADLALAEHLADATAHALAAHDRGRRRFTLSWRWSWAALAATGLALFIPVRQSVLAPAEIAAADPLVVAAPLDGVIREVVMHPNQRVVAGETLLVFDDAALRSRYDLAVKALAVAETEHRAAEQAAFRDARSGAQLATLAAQVDLRRAELAYAAELLGRAVVRAESHGIALFADRNEWMGRPVRTGERIMALADPARVEIRVWLPVADAVVLVDAAEVRLFLDAEPLAPYGAVLIRASYAPEMSPAGVLSFRLAARLEGDSRPRIGLRGTAKIYGEPVSLGFYLFRRPISALRQRFGL